MPPGSDHLCNCGHVDTCRVIPEIVEHVDETRGRIMTGGDDIHRRNLSTVASPVILMFDGFHNVVYHLYLATRYLQFHSPTLTFPENLEINGQSWFFIIYL